MAASQALSCLPLVTYNTDQHGSKLGQSHAAHRHRVRCTCFLSWHPCIQQPPTLPAHHGAAETSRKQKITLSQFLGRMLLLWLYIMHSTSTCCPGHSHSSQSHAYASQRHMHMQESVTVKHQHQTRMDPKECALSQHNDTQCMPVDTAASSCASAAHPHTSH